MPFSLILNTENCYYRSITWSRYIW